jgi:hypothetical protein
MRRFASRECFRRMPVVLHRGFRLTIQEAHDRSQYFQKNNLVTFNEAELRLAHARLMQDVKSTQESSKETAKEHTEVMSPIECELAKTKDFDHYKTIVTQMADKLDPRIHVLAGAAKEKKGERFF